MAPERSNPLHNFNLPSRLRWGAQRYLRCKKVDADDDNDPQQNQQPQPPSRSNFPPRSDDGSHIEAIGQKLMLDFKLRMDNLKVVVGGAADEDKEKEKIAAAEASVAGEGDGAESSRPWNLRTRRSPAPGPEVVVEKKRKERSSPVKRVRGGCSVSEDGKVRVPLKREEIEEDFLMMAGIKPRRRPSKRPRAIQKQLDTLFPGLWLTQVTPENYDVPEAPES